MADNGSVARRSSNIHRNITITPFLNKLYSMVDDSASDDLIRWSEDGNSFLVINHEEFAKDVLPRFFKHNNFSSFVRQLNMYGFHKVPHLQQGGLAADDPDAESWEFSNDHFQRGQPDLMHFIRRKKGNATNTSAEAPSGDYGDDSYQQEASSNESEDNASSVAETSAATQTAGVRKTAAATAATSKKPRPSRKPPVDLGRVLKEIQVIRDHQMTISADMKRLQSENRSLWMQASAAEERYKRHQATIDKILRFLATVFSPDNQHGEIHPPLRRLISHVSQGKNNVQEAATQGKSTHTGASTPEKRAMPPVSPSPIETLQGGSRSGIYETADSVGAQQPPDKRMRREQPSSSSRITEMPSASPPVYSSKRKVSNPMSTALTRTHLMRPLNELILTGAGSGADANALVTSPNNTYGGLRAQSKSIEQLQSEIDYLGHSLENLTRHLQYGGGQPSIPIAPNNLSAAAAALSGLQSSHNPLADSVQQMQHQQMYQHQQQQQQQQQTAVPTSTTTGAQNIDLASILSGDTLNNLAMALSSADTSQMTLPVSSSSMGNPGILDDASMASLGLTGNPPTVTPQVAEKGVGDNLDPAVLMDMLKTVTPEQYDYLQNYFRLISGSNTSVPLLTASNGTAATQSPDVLLNETPFLDFVDPTAADAPISSSSAASGTAAAADYVHRTNNYAQIILDALNSSAGEATDPLLAASILGTSSSAQPSMSVGAPVEPKSSNTSTPAQQNNQ